jgi:hypothetical protein
VALYCGDEINWTGPDETGAEDCTDLENLTGKFEEISFIRASDFFNDSSTGKFIRKLESKNDPIRRQIVTAQQLSHLMEHKLQLIVNGIWLEHDVAESLFPIVSIRNSTGNELEVLYFDCSLADINLQFLDLFEFTSTFVFWFHVTKGICFVILIGIFIKKEIGFPNDIKKTFIIIFVISLGLSLTGFDFIFYFLPTFFAIYLNFLINMVWISLLLSL